MATLRECWSNMLARTPGRTALHTSQGSLTYSSLDERSSRLAVRIRCYQGQDAVIAVPFGEDYFIALHACMRAGITAVPLDFSQPEDLLRSQLQRLSISCTIAHPSHPVFLGEGHVTVYLGEQGDPGYPAGALVERGEDRDGRLERPLYRLFTSGSSGEQTLVTIGEGSVAHYMTGLTRQGVIPPPEATRCCVASHLTTMQILGFWRAVLTGETFIPIDPKVEGLGVACDRLLEARPAILNGFPSLLGEVLHACRPDGVLTHTHTLGLSGEPLKSSWLESIRDRLPGLQHISYNYASTEALAVASWTGTPDQFLAEGRIPVGYPSGDKEVTLEDEEGRPVPTGEVGEIVVRSAYISTGIQGREAERRMRYDPSSGVRTYRTGDLGRMRPDGMLEHLGRIDRQIKINGVRIDPYIVEQRIETLAGMRHCHVTGLERNVGTTLIAAYVSDEVLDGAVLRRRLRTSLPSSHLPSIWLRFDALPMTDRGKPALHAIDEMIRERLASDVHASGRPLGTPTEQALATCWTELLGVEVNHRDADFFHLGGHSLHLMRLMQSIRHVWGVSPDLQTLLEASSLEDMAARIDAHRQPSDQHAAGVPTPLRLWEADGTGGMYFCDGGLGNNVRIVRTLAARQGWTWNTYHMPTPHLHTDDSGETSLEAITKRYAQTILDVHVEGPIVLVGFCLAGLEAHATACRLQQTSPHPVQLILIDTVHPDGLAMPGRIDPKDPDTDTATGDVTRHIGVREPAMDIDALEGIGREAVARGILDPEWYLHRNADVADAGVDPVIHYLAEGWREGRLPSPWFHADTYALLEPGFRERHADPVRDFLNLGVHRASTRRGILGLGTRWKELEKGDVPHRIFDADWHIARYPEIADGPYPPLTHYVLHGWAEHRTPALHFDKWVYHAICRSFDPFRHNPVLHYLLIGQYDPVVEKAVRALTTSPAEAEALVAGGWFEPEAYARRYADTRLLGRPGLDHFMSIGWRYGRSPFTGYDPDAFARQFPGFIPGQQNPLRHLLELGSLPIRVRTSPETAKAEASPTSDQAPSPLNSTTIASNPPNLSVAQAEMGPAEREFLVALGRIRKGYRPAFFSGRIYLCANQHLHNVDPLLGWTKGLHGHIQSHPLRGGHDTILGDDLEANADIFRSIFEGIFSSTS